MSEVEMRIKLARFLDLDPQKVSPEKIWFAWYPVRIGAWSPRGRRRKWRWLCYVKRFRPLGLITEYYELD